MKLKHKLIPLASAAAVCATVAPITLTSCGIGGTDLLKRYKTKYDQHEYGYYTQIEATQEYTKALMKNSDLFTDDLLWSKSQYYNNLESIILEKIAPVTNISFEKLIKIEKANAKVSNLKFTTQPLKYEGKDLDVPTLSFDFEYKTNVSFDLSNLFVPSQIGSESGMSQLLQMSKIEFDAKLSYENIPFWFDYNNQSSYVPIGVIWSDLVPSNWAFTPIIQWMIQYAEEDSNMDLPTPWSIKTDIGVKISRDLTIMDQDISEETNVNFDYSLTSTNIKNWLASFGNAAMDEDAEVKTLIFYMTCLPDGAILALASKMSNGVPNSFALNTTLMFITGGGACALSHYMLPADFNWKDK